MFFETGADVFVKLLLMLFLKMVLMFFENGADACSQLMNRSDRGQLATGGWYWRKSLFSNYWFIIFINCLLPFQWLSLLKLNQEKSYIAFLVIV